MAVPRILRLVPTEDQHAHSTQRCRWSDVIPQIDSKSKTKRCCYTNEALIVGASWVVAFFMVWCPRPINTWKHNAKASNPVTRKLPAHQCRRGRRVHGTESICHRTRGAREIALLNPYSVALCAALTLICSQFGAQHILQSQNGSRSLGSPPARQTLAA